MTTYANRGKGFESELEQTHAWYAKMGMAWLARFHVPMIIVGRRRVYVAKTWVDYAGFLAGGRAILLEAKSIAKKHPWKPDVKHQLDMIQLANRQGALGLYVIRVGVDTCYLWRPPTEYVFGDKVAWSDCARIDRQLTTRPWPWLERITELGW